ncbi:MAG TPA: hypothetical protein VMY35_00310 [Phycisphaerae bacterium]|nr:hypothetical protein [Phycisphaerae bacterium]
MASLGILSSAMVDEIEAAMGWTSPSGAQSAWALARLNDGYDRFLKGLVPGSDPPQFHDWLFMHPYSTITVWPTMTGAASGAPVYVNPSSTVTSAAAMFYASMIGHSVVFTATGNSYTITSYTSSTVVVVSGDASGEADEDVLTVTADGRYSLPTDFGGMGDEPVYAYASGASLPDFGHANLRKVYRELRDSATTDDPVRWALEPKARVATAVQAWWLRVEPVPDTARTVILPYRVAVSALTDSATEYCVAPIEDHRTILQCGKAAAEQQQTHAAGPEEFRAQLMMAESIAFDRGMYSNAQTVQSMYDADSGLEA